MQNKFLSPFSIIEMVSFIVLMAICNSCNTKEPDKLEHPNVLFIAIDDLNDWTEVLSGNSQSLTPNLKAFANESVNFKHNYCASPGCNPSRSAVLTGLHTYNSGMYSNYQDWRKVPAMQKVPTLPQYFKANNYYTAGAGKIFHYSQVDSIGWDDYFPSQKKNMPNDYIPKDAPLNMPPFKYMYNMFDWGPIDVGIEKTGDYQSVSYINSQLGKKHDKPFFLACGLYRPHLPWYVPQEYFDRFPLDSIKLPEVLENDLDDLGDHAKEIIQRGGNYHKHVVEAGLWKEAIQGYLASISYADDMVGNLLENLAKSAYAENTIVVIWSDHGWQLGEKHHWRKFALWENVIKTVMMIKVPEGTKALPEGSKNGFANNGVSSLLDIYPTLNDLCNLQGRENFDGQSLVNLLKNPDTKDERSVITTYDYGDYSIRKNNWHYIQYIDGSKELYDLSTDNEEFFNLSTDVNYSNIIDQLSAEIPKNPIDLPEESLLELMEHHIPPIRSKEFYYSKERAEWMKRFENIE